MNPPQHVHEFRDDYDCACGTTFDDALAGADPLVLEVTCDDN